MASIIFQLMTQLKFVVESLLKVSSLTIKVSLENSNFFHQLQHYTIRWISKRQEVSVSSIQPMLVRLNKTQLILNAKLSRKFLMIDWLKSSIVKKSRFNLLKLTSKENLN